MQHIAKLAVGGDLLLLGVESNLNYITLCLSIFLGGLLLLMKVIKKKKN